jgi:hypothetical protein
VWGVIIDGRGRKEGKKEGRQGNAPPLYTFAFEFFFHISIFPVVSSLALPFPARLA